MYLVFYPPGDPVASVMSKVSRTVAFSVTDKSVIHGKTFTSIDEVIAEVREHDDVYVGGTYILLAYVVILFPQ
ncbi:hypothetical protein AC249_AIPGENE17546 [Exaiptasia diaphana]|nr:hypothetical protein AC249_AIPGENE17546 [Exaiptasia diaphana]